jgi:hypothetical protein
VEVSAARPDHDVDWDTCFSADGEQRADAGCGAAEGVRRTEFDSVGAGVCGSQSGGGREACDFEHGFWGVGLCWNGWDVGMVGVGTCAGLELGGFRLVRLPRILGSDG